MVVTLCSMMRMCRNRVLFLLTPDSWDLGAIGGIDFEPWHAGAMMASISQWRIHSWGG